ncbi:nucleoside hydrolase [Amycolatopsis viridis]|uniref:Purine nucleosidase/ribosylpyrimidine nucleosidase n=1 Tax=Amycolatopsis viridis TaxID=185678 RepID=A0ABX0SWU0_9PSEU|nr:nucleoside hydrolase [Amycolatopsis viridis]NIH80998.1 purine nucleosidase/ribosylpyrimidine nucleosidase [Amycolatopsis viridis]
MTRKVILDVDTGTDDAVAIMLAALHPDLDLAAVTTVSGNVPLAATTDNTLRVLDAIGRPDIPVHPGLAHPVARRGFPGPRHFEAGSARDMHGTSLPLPAPRTAARAESAVEFLLHTLRTTTEPVTLVPVGPLSTIATVLAADPSVRDALAEVVIMGGAHHYGNVTPSAEFNFWADPEAAAMVLSAGLPRLTLVTLDATHRALVTRDDCVKLSGLGTPAGRTAADLITRRIDAYSAGRGVAADDAAPVHDAVCIAYLLRPEVITTRPVHVEVETTGSRTVGRAVMDLRPNATGEPNAQVAFDARADVLVDLLLSAFA